MTPAVSPILSRRSVVVASLALASTRIPAAASDGILPAIRWAETADAAYLASGRVAADLTAARQSMPAGWRAYRLALLRVRMLARAELHALTPGTVGSAAALVAYHTSRATRAGNPGAMRSSRRLLRDVFARPGAIQAPRPPP